jgi:hypothetical protein
VEKYYRTRHASDDNMAHAHCILIRKATNSEYVIGTAIAEQQWHLNVTLYVHCLSCLLLVLLQVCKIIHEGLYVKCLLLLFHLKQNQNVTRNFSKPPHCQI